jgi:glycosyltransferase involved in cell wall biosynthesis
MAVDTSVIICNYNNKPFLGRAIRSCLKQSLPKDRYEVIVVDDASTDKSEDVICGFTDKVKPIMLKKNVGVAEASNIGIRAAQGSYIIRVDADDYISEHALLILTEILDKNHDIGFVYPDHFRVDDKENIIQRVDLWTTDLIFRHGAGIIMRKRYLEDLGLYDKSLRNAEDYDLLKRYIKNFNGYHLRLPLYRYRIHPKQMTADDAERKMWETKSDENRKQDNRG